MHICPDCRGKKSAFGIACIMDQGCRPITMVCRFCNGTGVVDVSAFKRWRIGDAMRRARVKRGSSQREQAALLGISQILLRRLRLANNLEDFEQLAGYLRRARTTSNMDGRMLQPARSAKIAAALRGLVTRLLSKEHASGVWSRGQRRIIKFLVANNLRAHMNALVGKGMATLLNPRARPFSLYAQSAVRYSLMENE